MMGSRRVRRGGLLTTIYFIGGGLEEKGARADQKQVQHRQETKNSSKNSALVLDPFQAHF